MGRRHDLGRIGNLRIPLDNVAPQRNEVGQQQGREAEKVRDTQRRNKSGKSAGNHQPRPELVADMQRRTVVVHPVTAPGPEQKKCQQGDEQPEIQVVAGRLVEASMRVRQHVASHKRPGELRQLAARNGTRRRRGLGRRGNRIRGVLRVEENR